MNSNSVLDTNSTNIKLKIQRSTVAQPRYETSQIGKVHGKTKFGRGSWSESLQKLLFRLSFKASSASKNAIRTPTTAQIGAHLAAYFEAIQLYPCLGGPLR